MDLSCAALSRAGARALLVLVLLSSVTADSRGQEALLPGAGPYDPRVPTVAELRGFPTGATFSTDREIERVLTGLAAASNRILLTQYGSSVEKRPLRLAWVSSPENLARLDSLRAVNVGHMRGEAVDLEDQPIFVWLSFGVHGDEASSPEAALELMYHLAAAQDEATRAWLANTIVVIDPLLNPDGHARYVTWFRSVMGERPDPDPSAREHRPPWPGGRTNHWYFDLNRDWAWGVQPETRARAEVYLATLPQVHVDFHEMDSGSTYFFFPPAAPIHPFYPASTAAWGRVFGEANATAFDAHGWPYFTEEDYDLFYPGYGDSWPSFYGATGMTYEQAGGGDAGVILEREGKEPLILVERVRHHLLAALTTIETAVENRRPRLTDFAAFWGPGTRVAPGAPAAYLVPRNPGADELAALLARQGIRVDTLASATAVSSLTPYPGVHPDRDSLPPGTLLLPGDQPLGRYLAALMSPGRAPPDTSLFYDITGWALPYLFGVPAYRASSAPPGASGAWQRPPAAAPLDAAAQTVAFVWDYASPSDVTAAARLQSAGYRIQVAERALELGGKRRRAGTFILPVLQPDSVAGTVTELARAIATTGVVPAAVSSFHTASGIDLGSGHVRGLRRARVALAAGPAVHPASLGAARLLLERENGIEVDVVWLEDLGAAPGTDADSLEGGGRQPLDLNAYTAVILPDGPGADAYASALGEAGGRRLADYVDQGGTLIGVRTGAAYLAEGESGLTEIELLEKPPASPEERRAPHAEREADEERERIPGTLLAAVIDTTSVLGYGYPDGAAAVMAREPVEFGLAETGNAWLYADLDPLAGYLPPPARKRLPGTPYAILVARGRGHVVLFADDPAFRGIMHALKKLYLNAVLLVPGS